MKLDSVLLRFSAFFAWIVVIHACRCSAENAAPFPSSADDSRAPDARKTVTLGNGGSLATIGATDLAARWLAYHQEPDGHWNSVKYGAGNKVDTAVTALSLLALLRAGNSTDSGEYKENVKRAVSWLMHTQQATGVVFDQTDAGAHRGIGYPSAMATLALCEAASRAHSPDLQRSAAAAIKYAAVHQEGDGAERLGWRYTPKSTGDISVSGWWIQALCVAKRAGIPVDHATLDGAIRFLDNVEIKSEGISRYAYQHGKEPNKRRDAIGNYCRHVLGGKPADLQKSVEVFVNDGGIPSWGQGGESVDLYYWYYGTYCVFSQGGDVWNQWNAGLKKALTENQCKQGDDAGSWPVVGDFAGEWGRVGQTALASLCLEVYCQSVLPDKPKPDLKGLDVPPAKADPKSKPADGAVIKGDL